MEADRPHSGTASSHDDGGVSCVHGFAFDIEVVVGVGGTHLESTVRFESCLAFG